MSVLRSTGMPTAAAAAAITVHNVATGSKVTWVVRIQRRGCCRFDFAPTPAFYIELKSVIRREQFATQVGLILAVITVFDVVAVVAADGGVCIVRGIGVTGLTLTAARSVLCTIIMADEADEGTLTGTTARAGTAGSNTEATKIAGTSTAGTMAAALEAFKHSLINTDTAGMTAAASETLQYR